GVLISKFSNPQFSEASRRSGKAWSAAARPKPASRAAFWGKHETSSDRAACVFFPEFFMEYRRNAVMKCRFFEQKAVKNRGILPF
ncbi:hypothetical protein LU000_11700, partial [Neisseria gonorrhoeae]